MFPVAEASGWWGGLLRLVCGLVCALRNASAVAYGQGAAGGRAGRPGAPAFLKNVNNQVVCESASVSA
jgi:hypothetical protein